MRINTRILEMYRKLSLHVRATFWFLICSFLQKGVSTITTPIFTRLLTTAEYGQFDVFNSWLSIISIFVTMQIYFGVYITGLVKFEEDRDVFSSSLQGLHFTMVVVWTAIYLTFHKFWNDVFSLSTVQMLSMLMIIWSSGVFNFWASEQKVKLNYISLIAVTLVLSIIQPAVGIVFVLNARDKVTARILSIAIVGFLGYTGLFVAQMKRGKRFFSARYWKYALAFHLPLIPHYLSQTVLNSADRIMIQNMVGKSEAGIYGLAYSVALIMTLFNTALMQTITPWMCQKIKDQLINDIAPIAYMTLILIAGVNILLILFAPEVIRIFAPLEYYDAIWIIPPVVMSVYFMYMYDLFAKFAFYYEKTTYIMLASMIGAVLNIILNWIFIKRYNYYAAGYTTLLSYMTYAIVHYIIMRIVCRKNINGVQVYELRILMKITCAFLSFGFIGLALYNYIILRYCLIVIICLITILKYKALNKVITRFRN